MITPLLMPPTRPVPAAAIGYRSETGRRPRTLYAPGATIPVRRPRPALCSCGNTATEVIVFSNGDRRRYCKPCS